MREVKSLFFLVLALVTGLIFLRFIAQYSTKPKAVAPNVTLTMNPKSAVLASGEQKAITVSIQTDSTANKISALDLNFQAQGNIQIVSATAPVNAANNDATVFTELVKTVSNTSAKLSYISIRANDQLPSAVTFTLTIKNDGFAGSGSLLMTTANSKVTGNITENTYTWGTVDQGQFTCTGGSNPTSTPGAGNPTATPGNATSTPGSGQPLVDLSMTPNSGVFPAGATKNITIDLKTRSASNKISAFDIYFQSTGSIVIADASGPSNGANGDTTLFSQLVRTVTANQAQLAYTSIRPDSQLPSHVSITFTLRNNGTSDAPGTFTVVTGTSKVTGNIQGNNYAWGTVDAGTFNGAVVTSTPTSTPGGATATPGGNCVTPTPPTSLRPNGTVTNGVNTVLTWDVVTNASKYALRINDIGGSGTTGYVPDADVVADNIPTNSYSHTFTQGHVYKWWVHAINSCGDWSASNEAFIYVSGPGGATPSPTSLPTATPVSRPTIDPNATPTPQFINLAIRLRLQGVTTQPSKQTKNAFFTVTLFQNTDRDRDHLIPLSYTMNYIGNGIWRGTQQVQLVPGTGFTFYIEGEKHLRRRICDGRPTDITPGSYHCANQYGNITINPGNIEFDFSRVIMFTGDVPFKGENDGVIDSYDISYLRTHLGISTGDNAYVGDLNYDGLVDTQDYTLAITAMLKQRSDE
ncbi:MAG: hypothetical protein RI947_1331 [Candidatus Parcubacteria bacterium]|jgi:hypothetical protein